MSVETHLTANGSARGLTAVPGVKVGHHTLTERPTGCTVVIADGGAVGGVDVRGSAPGTRETDLLSPLNTVERVHAIVLAGGSAFGLDAASGVVRFLEERGIGFPTATGPVPIVPAAIIYDLRLGNSKIRPDAGCGYQAAKAASDAPVAEGNVGAGAGATAGKIAGIERAMKSGVGSATQTAGSGLIVAALAVANPFGSIVDPATGRTIAGVRSRDGKRLLDPAELLDLLDNLEAGTFGNTTLGVIATNARLSKVQAQKVAQMAHDGLARAIYPAHTSADGDTVFTLATGTFQRDTNVALVGALAAQAMTDAIVAAARAAAAIPGYPAAADFTR